MEVHVLVVARQEIPMDLQAQAQLIHVQHTNYYHNAVKIKHFSIPHVSGRLYHKNKMKAVQN